MIVWINGPFGAGKTTLAEELHRRIPSALVFDPEEIGFALRRLVPPPPTGDFQDLPIWRSMTRHALLEMRRLYDVDVIVPMTLAEPAYVEEIIVGLRAAGERVQHFFLRLDSDLLRRRITDQVIVPDDPVRDQEVRRWRLDQVDRCLAAGPGLPAGTVFLDSGTAATAGLADEVVASAGR